MLKFDLVVAKSLSQQHTESIKIKAQAEYINQQRGSASVLMWTRPQFKGFSRRVI